jgi:hypothetical protein
MNERGAFERNRLKISTRLDKEGGVAFLRLFSCEDASVFLLKQEDHNDFSLRKGMCEGDVV